MADCPGVLRLAQMADGGLARLRAPGGALTAAQARAVATVAVRLGSGEIDLTNRANLQIRGLARDGGAALAAALEPAGFRFFGAADRRRNILVDPFSGLDRSEIRDLTPLAAALDAAIIAADWIGGLSPKFSFVLDGGGRSKVAAAPSDVRALATAEGVLVAAGRVGALGMTEEAAAAAMMAVAEATSRAGPDVRAKDLSDDVISAAFGRISEVAAVKPLKTPSSMEPRFGAVATGTDGVVALSLPVPVGRLDVAMLTFAADLAAREGEGKLALAPWSAIVLPGARADRASELLALSEAHGFTPVAVADRLRVTACAGAPACERAREPAKALGAAVLALATRDRRLLPANTTSLHLSACQKGCAGSAVADLLLLGSSDRDGWTAHRASAPRSPGASEGRLDAPTAEETLKRLAVTA